MNQHIRIGESKREEKTDAREMLEDWRQQKGAEDKKPTREDATDERAHTSRGRCNAKVHAPLSPPHMAMSWSFMPAPPPPPRRAATAAAADRRVAMPTVAAAAATTSAELALAAAAGSCT